MSNFSKYLKQKGPGGVPIWAYAAGTVAILYFGYRFFKGRSGSGSSSQDQSSNSVDTSGDGFSSPGYVGDPGAGAIDNIPPDSTQDTNPPAGDSTGIINGPDNIGEPPPAKKKKAHKGMHDHKQGIKPTNKRAIHRRRPGHKQAPHAHAPKNNKRPPSHEKAKTATAIPHATAVARASRGGATPPPKPGAKVAKVTPPPVGRMPEEPRIVAKAPPKTSAAKRKR